MGLGLRLAAPASGQDPHGPRGNLRTGPITVPGIEHPSDSDVTPSSEPWVQHNVLEAQQ